MSAVLFISEKEQEGAGLISRFLQGINEGPGGLRPRLRHGDEEWSLPGPWQRLRRAEDARGQGTGAAVELEALPALGSVHRHEAGYCTGGPGSPRNDADRRARAAGRGAVADANEPQRGVTREILPCGQVAARSSPAPRRGSRTWAHSDDERGRTRLPGTSCQPRPSCCSESCTRIATRKPSAKTRWLSVSLLPVATCTGWRCRLIFQPVFARWR